MRSKAKPPTKAESEHMRDSKESCCIPCLVWARAGNMPMDHVAVESDYHHCKSGNIRRGHMFGFANCLWHHQGRVQDGWTHAQMRAWFGPSLMDGSRLFIQTYGSDDELISLQNEVLNGRG